jgi:transaldolase
MRLTYFQKLARDTKTRFWVNNPTLEEARLAIAAGAISCTTNPTYAARMLRSESEGKTALALVDEAVRQTPEDGKAAEIVQRNLARRIVEEFSPLYRARPLLEGFVSVQGDPRASGDPDRIIGAGLEDRKLGQNCIIKIPVTGPGLVAIEDFVSRDIPVIATEVMGIAQAIAACEVYERVAKTAHRRPPFYVTHITGIFDEFLAARAREASIQVRPGSLFQAGSILARRQHRILMERGFAVTMMGGGARGLHHFTEMVGADVHITINWSGTADKLIEQDPPIVDRIHHDDPRDVVDELTEKFPEFRKAYEADGLAPGEFEEFGPAAYFRGMFIQGWEALEEVVRQRRRSPGTTSREVVA